MEVNKNGFVVKKSLLSQEQIKKIKNDLNVSPFTNFKSNNFYTKTFKVFKETKECYILPVYYAIHNLNLKTDDVIFKKNNSPVNFKNVENNICLRKGVQQDCYNNCLKETKKEYGGGIISLDTGMGKCLGKGEKVITFDGSLKNVENVKKGDILMGDDNTPRNVLSTVNGTSDLYTIITEHGICHTVNESHILVLKNSMQEPQFCNYKNSVDNTDLYYISWWENNEYNLSCLFTTYTEALEYKREVSLRHQKISEISVLDYIKSSQKFKKYFKAFTVPINFNLSNKEFFKFSWGEKMNFINKILDETKLKFYKEDVEFLKEFLFLCRSVGFVCSYIECSDTKYKLTISGYPKNINLIDFKVEFKEVGQYYGFTLDGNRRFLFDDFMVTHNTVVSLKLITEARKKTLVIVNKIELLDQWEKEIKKWLPNAKTGRIQGSVFNHEDCDIVLGMLQSISLKKNISAVDFEWVEMAIIDECHNIAAEMFSGIMFKIRPAYLFGLTATLERKDKLEKIISWYMGDTLYNSNVNGNSLKQTSEVYILKYFEPFNSSKEVYLKNGTIAVSTMLSNIAGDNTRNDYIVQVLNKIVLKDTENKLNVLVISDRIAQLKYIHKKLKGDFSGLFIGSMKREELDKTKTKKIILGTYGLVNEGFNLPKLNCLLFATPRSSIIQAIGRIYRKTHDITPMIIDIVDDFSIFKAQHYKRKSIYKKSIKDCIIFHKELNNESFNSADCAATDCAVTEYIEYDEEAFDNECLIDTNY